MPIPPGAKKRLLTAALSALLIGFTPAIVHAAPAPAFYSNVIFDFNSGQPTYFKTRSENLSGHLYDLTPDPGRTRLMNTTAVMPLEAYAGVLEAERNAANATHIRTAIDQAATIPPLTLPAFAGGTATAPGAGPDAPGVTAEPPPEKKLKLDIRGFRYLKYRDYSSSGDSQTFLSQNGLFTYGDKFEQGTNLQFTAESHDIQISGSINELPLQDRDMTFDVLYGPMTAKLGDFVSEFKAGSLATLDKRITGAEVSYDTDKYTFGFVSSQSRSEPRTISFNGNNTHGPFDLNTFEVVPGSASVLLNGQTLPETAYDIDHYSGQISFCSTTTPPTCTVIKTSDTVQVVYEQKLLLSLKGGNIQGFRGGYKLPSGNGDVGMAWLTQEANRAAQRTRKNDTQSFSGSELLAQGAAPDAQRTIRLSPPNTRFPGLVFLVKNTETIFRNNVPLVRGSDYSIAYAGYGRGELLLAATPSTTDSFTVSYSFYDDQFINVSREEDIVDDGGGSNVFSLLRSQVYAGPESVLYCTSDSCLTSEFLEPGPDKDYTIDESNNTIIINSAKRPSAIENTFLRITYYYVPADAPESSRYDHNVRNVFGNYRLNDTTGLSFEYAASQSDAAKTPVQIMNEIVVRPLADITCPVAPDPAEECQYTLANVNIEEDSDILRINNSGSALRRGADYNLDFNTARLIFTGGVVLPAGAVIYADYRFNPDVDLGLVNGAATRLSGNTTLRGLSLSFKKENTDTFFAPIGGNNTLETDRFDYTASLPINDFLRLETRRSRFVNAQDIFETFVTTTRDNQNSIAYTGDSWLRGVTLTFGDTSRTDNRPVPAIDATRDTARYEFDFDVPWFKNMSARYALGSEDFSDNTGVTDNTSSDFSDIVISYKPRNELSLDLAIQNTGVQTSGPTGFNDTRNTARHMLLTYQPVPLITLTADVDSQKQTNSSPLIDDTTIDTSAVRLTTLPFWKIRVLSLSITQQDRPSQFTGGTQSSVQSLSFTADAGAGISITPLLTVSDSSSPGASSKTSLSSVRVEYLPANKPYQASIKKEWSDTSSLSTSGPTGSDTQRLSWDVKYKFALASSITYRFNTSATSITTSPTVNTENRHILHLLHFVGDKWKLQTSYTIFDRTAAYDTSERSLEFNSEYRFTKSLFWNLSYSLIDYSVPTRPETAYSGKILETEFRLEF